MQETYQPISVLGDCPRNGWERGRGRVMSLPALRRSGVDTKWRLAATHFNDLAQVLAFTAVRPGTAPTETH